MNDVPSYLPSVYASLRPRTRRHLGYAAVVLLVGVLSTYLGALPIFRSHLMAYLSIGDNHFGLLFGLGPLAGVVGGLVGGALLDRWGPRRVIRLCLVGVGGSMLLAGLGGRSYWALAAAVALGGAFSTALFIALNAYLARLFPGHQRRVISLNFVAGKTGGFIWPVGVEGLLGLQRRWPGISFAQVLHLPFFLVGGLLLAGSLIYRPRRPRSTGEGRPPPVRTRWQWQRLLLPASAWGLALLFALHVAMDTTSGVWMARFLESGSFPAVVIAPGLVMSARSGAYILSRGLLLALPENRGRRTLLVVPGLLGGSLMLVGILSRDAWLTSAGFVLGAFCWSPQAPAQISALMQTDRQRFGLSMAMSFTLSGLLSFGGINLIGLLGERLGEAELWRAMLIVPAGFMLVGLGGLAWVLRWGGRLVAPEENRAAVAAKVTPQAEKGDGP